MSLLTLSPWMTKGGSTLSMTFTTKTSTDTERKTKVKIYLSDRSSFCSVHLQTKWPLIYKRLASFQQDLPDVPYFSTENESGTIHILNQLLTNTSVVQDNVVWNILHACKKLVEHSIGLRKLIT